MPRDDRQIECRSCTLFLRELSDSLALRRHVLRASQALGVKKFHPLDLGNVLKIIFAILRFRIFLLNTNYRKLFTTYLINTLVVDRKFVRKFTNNLWLFVFKKPCEARIVTMCPCLSPKTSGTLGESLAQKFRNSYYFR